MGNRAVITGRIGDKAPVIYLHWNGGRASVVGLLRAARVLGFRGTDRAAMDTLAELWAESFFDCPVGHTIYRETYGQSDTDNHDNGVYIIDDDLNIIGRRFNDDMREEYDEEKTTGIYRTVIDFYLNETKSIEK